MIHRVKDLSPEQRQAAEMLLGNPVSEEEAVSIKRLGNSTVISSSLSPDQKIEALRMLKERLAESAAGVDEEVDEDMETAAVNEALRSVRPAYLPIA